MQQTWAILIYVLSRLGDWQLGRGKHGGIEWFARTGLDFCCMGVTITGILVYNVIENNPSGDKLKDAITNAGISTGSFFLICFVIIVFLWGSAFVCDRVQNKIYYRKSSTGWTREKKMRHRTIYCAFVAAIGVLLFFVPMNYLF